MVEWTEQSYVLMVEEFARDNFAQIKIVADKDYNVLL